VLINDSKANGSKDESTATKTIKNAIPFLSLKILSKMKLVFHLMVISVVVGLLQKMVNQKIMLKGP